MKKLIILSFLIISTSTFSNDLKKDFDVLQILTSHLDYGEYSGIDDLGNKCEVSVEQNVFPKGKALPASYYLKITSNGEVKGEFHFFTLRIMGGRGDCTEVGVDTPLLLELHNHGQYFPCLSHPKRSSSKGLGVYEAPILNKKEVTTFNYYYKEEASCLIDF